MNHLKKNGFITLAIFSMFFAACGGGSPTPPPPPPAVSLSMASSVKAYVGESKTIPVTAQNTDFTVSVSQSGCGCEKSGNNIVCTPTVSGAYTVTATATADAAKKVSATVTVPELEVLGGNSQTLYADDAESAIITFNAAGNWTAAASDGSGGSPAWLSLSVVSGLSVDDSDIRLYDYDYTQSNDGDDYGDEEVSVNAVNVSGGSGNNFISVTLQPNDSMADRTATITITTSTGQITITITQRYTKRDGTPLTSEYRTVTFNIDGSVYATRQVDAGSGLGDAMPENPTKSGYDFVGWNTSQLAATANFYLTTPLTSDMSVYAIWTIRTYAETFYSNNGSEEQTIEVRSGSLLYEPKDPIRNNYTFAGWYGDSDLTEPVTFPFVVTSSKDFYAKWTPSVPISSILLNKYVLTLPAGETDDTLFATVQPVNANNRDFIRWDTTNPKVAIVDEYGVVEALSPGIAYIFALVEEENRSSGYCEVTVKEASEPLNPNTVIRYDIESDTSNTLSDRIKYSFTYDNYDYYYIYLGRMDNIPYYVFNGFQWRGGAPITYKFTSSTTTVEELREGVSQYSSTARSTSDSYAFTLGGGLSLSTEIKASFNYLEFAKLSVKNTIAAEAHWEQYRNSSSGFTQTTSLEKTVERISSFASSTSYEFTKEFTDLDQPGEYRWTLFASSDVYLYVIRDSNTGGIYFEFREYVRPTPPTFHLDFSKYPGDLRKINENTIFEFDPSFLRNLPKPTLGPGMVYFDLDGGYFSDSRPLSQHGPVTLDIDPQKLGSTFNGWNTEPYGTGATYRKGDDYSPPYNESGYLYAQWVLNGPVSATIIFNINGGFGTTPQSVSKTVGEKITLPGAGASGFSRSEKMFAGWNLDSAGTSTNYKGGDTYTVTGDSTLYAKWLDNPTDFETIRSAYVAITDESYGAGLWNEAARYHQHSDKVSFSTFGVDIANLKEQGYQSIDFSIRLNACEVNDGGHHLYLYNSTQPYDVNLIKDMHVKFSFSGTSCSKNSWKAFDEQILRFLNVPISSFSEDYFVIRYAASGNGRDEWRNKDLRIKLHFKK